MIYTASMDKLTKGITLVVTLFILSIQVVPLIAANDFPAFSFALPSFLFLVILFTYGLSPRSYGVHAEGLTIYRPFRNRIFLKQALLSVQLVSKEEMRGSIRIFGVGGMFGYFGLFRNSNFGNMNWFASRRDGFVLIKQENGKSIVLTPDDPNAFVSECQMMIKG